MRLTLATWNLKTLGGRLHASIPLPEARLALIRDVLKKAPVIVALQEVTPGFAESLAGIRCSLSRRSPGVFDGGTRMLGVGLLVSGDVDVMSWSLVDRAPFPERTLVAEVMACGRTIHVVAFHSLTGVGHLKGKAAQFCSLAEYLVALEGDIVFMGDANEPRVDAPDRTNIQVWEGNGRGAEFLFGPQPRHGLQDAWRTFLGDGACEFPETGPLACSHRTGATDRRYDHIFVPPSWRVTGMTYDYDRGVAAGSDHALVCATVDLP